jgi:hypothetical protein
MQTLADRLRSKAHRITKTPIQSTSSAKPVKVAVPARPKRPTGRPRIQFKPETAQPQPVDLDIVRRLARIHCTQEEIAATFDINVNTLTAFPGFLATYRKGLAKGKKSLRRVMFEQAMDPNDPGHTTMRIWLSKQALGMREPPHEVTGAGGGPIKTELNIQVVSETAKKLTEQICAGKGTEG